MSKLNLLRNCVIFLAANFVSQIATAAPQASDYAATPPLLSNSADPFVMISLSVELTQQGEGYTDGRQTYVGNNTFCPGRLNNADVNGDGRRDVPNSTGICYHQDEIYIGYFDPKKCYVYDTTGSNRNTLQLPTSPSKDASSPNHPTPHHFRPVSMANAGHKCPGDLFSGNFMNWATMTAIDEFRYAMTGGARLVDTAGANAKTLLTRAHRVSWRFVNKAIRSAGLGRSGVRFSNSPIDVTPFNVPNLVAEGHERNNFIDSRPRYNGQSENTTTFYWIDNGTRRELGTYNIIVEVCNPDVGLEENCAKYTDGTNTWYKPEGVMMQNALDIRYALATYSRQSGNARHGGILRANAKYIGPIRPKAEGGVEENPNAEIAEDGTYIYDPDALNSQSGVDNSGILNYINNFGLNGYKSNDPVGELYYESLRYIKNLGPTPEYSAGLSDRNKDNFPVVNNWDDPVVDACQSNYIIAVGDQFAWADYNLPGSSISGSSPGGPSNPDTDINVTLLTNRVGQLERHFPGGLSLGRATAHPSGFRDNHTYYLAGLAYYARTSDLRDEANMFGDQTVKTFIVDTQEFNNNPPLRENNPLWLAAKYGGFDDINGDQNPNDSLFGPRSTDEWDRDRDGEPDSYTLSSQPANLISGLRAALNEIVEQVNSSSAAGTVTNTTTGDSLVVQALFKPKHTTEDGNIIEWGGLAQGLFIDKFGNIREDKSLVPGGKGDGRITDTDPAIIFEEDFAAGVTTVNRFQVFNDGAQVAATPFETGIEVEDLNPVWNARDELAKLTDLKNQRAYTGVVGSGAEQGRYIFTSIDSDGDKIVTNDDVIPFTEDEFAFNLDPLTSGNNFKYLGLSAAEEADAGRIVNYLRGFEDPTSTEYRSRTISFRPGRPEQPWILGDIVASSPIIDSGSSTATDYNGLYGDETIEPFLQKYRNARNVVYFGANDGMIHAVNAGFFDRVNSGFSTTGSNGETAHPLGAELWAYVPYNALPHLQWLKDKEYTHNYYVDGIPQLHTVNIFDDDEDHPGGWGKILVVGMSFGGGDFELDTDGDGTVDRTTHSSFVILDVTNPEKPPSLIAEVTHPELGFTTSRPALAVFRKRNPGTGSFRSPIQNDWYLVFGSGPYGNNDAERQIALKNAVSYQNAKMFVFDLNAKEFVQSGGEDYFEISTQPNGFVGGLNAVDWDFRDGYGTDVIYFGAVRGTDPTNARGDLMRFIPNDDGFTNPRINRLIVDRSSGRARSTSKPFSGVPNNLIIDNEFWVFAGSGRFFTQDDSLTARGNSFYGIKETVDSSGNINLRTEYSVGDLVDIDNVNVVFQPGSDTGQVVSDGGGTPFVAGRAVDDWVDLESIIDLPTTQGWKRDFDIDSQRQVGSVGLSDNALIYTVYNASDNICEPLGTTDLFGVNYKTGKSPAFSILGGTERVPGETIASDSVRLANGLVRDITLISGASLEGRSTIIGASSGGTSSGGTSSGGTSSGGTSSGGTSGGGSASASSSSTSSSGGDCEEDVGDGNVSVGSNGAVGVTFVGVCNRKPGSFSLREVPLPW